MGAAQTKAKKEYGTDIEGIDLIDLIATKYILTQIFQDLKNLTKIYQNILEGYFK